MRKILAAILLLACWLGISAQQLRRSMSPNSLLELSLIQDVTPTMLDSFCKLLGGSSWKVLEKDTDPSDGEMQLVAAIQMDYLMGEFVSLGNPHNGLLIHLKKHRGMCVDHVEVAFSNINEQKVFIDALQRMNFVGATDDTNLYRFVAKKTKQEEVKIEIRFRIDELRPTASIEVRR